MQFTIPKSHIIDVLSRIQGLTGRKSNLAITASVLVRATAEGLTLAATDLETGFIGNFKAEVVSEGSIAINARKFFEIVRDFPSDEIKVHEIENHWIEIGTEKVQYHIVGMNPDDFPEIPRIEDSNFFEMDAAKLKKMIEQTGAIGPVDEKRAHILGTYMERLDIEGCKRVRMVSTDGSRLSTANYNFDAGVDLPSGPGILIPKKGLIEVSKFINDEDTVRVIIKNNNIVFKKETETIIIRLLEGVFPKYEDIISKEQGFEIKIDKAPFAMLLRRMSILSSENYKGVVFKFEEDTLTVHSTNPEIGESREDMEIAYGEKPLEMAFNPKYFTDTLNVIDDAQVVLTLVDEEKPCLIEGENDKTFISVIMPMRI